jgi:hypothetical protein
MVYYVLYSSTRHPLGCRVFCRNWKHYKEGYGPFDGVQWKDTDSLKGRVLPLNAMRCMWLTNPPNSLEAKFFELDSLAVFCSKPPACVLFRPDNPKHSGFEGLNRDIFPIFPIEKSEQIKGFSVPPRQDAVYGHF